MILIGTVIFTNKKKARIDFIQLIIKPGFDHLRSHGHTTFTFPADPIARFIILVLLYHTPT